MYDVIKKLFRDTSAISFKAQYDDPGDSLWIDIVQEREKVGHIAVQNIEAPEIDVVLHSSSWYFSLPSNADLVDRLEIIYVDIIRILLTEKKDYTSRLPLHSKKGRKIIFMLGTK